MMGKKYIFTKDELNNVLDAENKIIIYGAGDYGKRIADYIISVGKESKIKCFWVTEKGEEHSYREIEILQSGEESLTGQDDLIIVAVSRVFLHEIFEIVQQYGKRYDCVTQELYDEIGGESVPVLDSRHSMPYEGLDFLLAGFFKCGTSSLYKTLIGVDDIYLSKKKESLYFNWCDNVENPKEKLARDYFNNIREGQLVGAIEPSFYRYAGRITNAFGRQIKILFLVRNPVDAIVSHLKMLSRNGDTSVLGDIYQKFGKVSSAYFFERCFEKRPIMDIFKYNDWIQQFLTYYSSEKIKIVIFEEMVKNPRKIVNDIMQFVGSSCEYVSESLPWSNEGKFIMEDVEGLEIAKRWSQLRNEYINGVSERSRNEVFSEFMEVERKYNQSKKIYDLKLSKDIRKKLEKYYYVSVRELEKMIKKDLSEVWF